MYQESRKFQKDYGPGEKKGTMFDRLENQIESNFYSSAREFGKNQG